MAQKERVIAINATGGGNTAISASTFARYVEITEDASGAAQGFKLTYADGSVANYKPGEVARIGNPAGALGGGAQPLVGRPQDTSGVATINATLYANAVSLGTATDLRVTEFN